MSHAGTAYASRRRVCNGVSGTERDPGPSSGILTCNQKRRGFMGNQPSKFAHPARISWTGGNWENGERLRTLCTLFPPVQNPDVLVAAEGRARISVSLRCTFINSPSNQGAW